MNINYAFFGSSTLSVHVLNELQKSGLKPVLIVSSPEKKIGRKQILTANIVKKWANDNAIEAFCPAKLDSGFAAELAKIVRQKNIEVFVVASYGKIVPKNILDIPKKGCLNIHPSLLPKYRGPAPLPQAMLDDAKKTGVTIMLMDQEMDHGPILAQKEITVAEWPVYEEFEKFMAEKGALLLAETLPKWLNGQIEARAQDHTAATFTRKIEKADGLINLNDDPYVNFRKIQAFHLSPQAYFLVKKNGKDIRVKITAATFGDNALKIQKVIPEGGKEMSYEDFGRGYKV